MKDIKPIVINKRQFFTLIEILIAIMILAIAASVVGVATQRLIRQQRFRTSVEKIVYRLQLAQDLMLVRHVDVDVVLDHDSKKLLCSMEVTDPLSKILEKVIEKKLLLPAIKTVAFIDPAGPVRHPLHIEFKSGGGRMSRGMLLLESSSGEKRYIALFGYPLEKTL